SKVAFDKVLLIDDNGNVTLGAPAIEGASVEDKVLQHLKGDKVIVIKKKRRKGFKKKNGHRQSLTQIVIEGINGSAPKKKAAKKAETTAGELTLKTNTSWLIRKVSLVPKMLENQNRNL